MTLVTLPTSRIIRSPYLLFFPSFGFLNPRQPATLLINSCLSKDFYQYLPINTQEFCILSKVCIFAADKGLVLLDCSGALACLGLSKDEIAACQAFCFSISLTSFFENLTPPFGPSGPSPSIGRPTERRASPHTRLLPIP